MIKKQITIFTVLILLLGVNLLVLELTKYSALKPHHELMAEASRRTEYSFNLLKAERIRLGYEIDPVLDPNLTGLIGVRQSDITTTLGILEAKRSTTNPNTAAMIVEQFLQLGLNNGDVVGLNLSGSFPALNVAALVAAEVLGLEVIAISSVGSSTYGANIENFNWVHMHHYLASLDIVSPPTAISLGGEGDLLLTSPNHVRTNAISQIKSMDYTFIEIEDFEENIIKRMYIYGQLDAFVNIGGNQFAFGNSATNVTTSQGVITEPLATEYGNGLISRYLNQNVPVIHLLGIRNLFATHALPYDPIPLPNAGNGDIYYHISYNIVYKYMSILSIIFSYLVMIYLFKKARFLRKA